MKNILFVCTGNTCRSCMAEGILRDILNKANKDKKFSVSSAGVFANIPTGASKYAIQVLKNGWGIDISSHKSKQLSKQDIKNADIILTMSRTHKYIILSTQKDSIGKVFTLKEYVKPNGANADIKDPYGGTYDDYKVCANEIKEYIQMFLEKYERGLDE